MHLSAPSHPLIHAFLLQRKEFHDARKIIVETPEQGKKLFAMMQALQLMKGGDSTSHSQARLAGMTVSKYRLIEKPADIVESMLYDDIAIYPIETLDWEIDPKEMQNMVFSLEKGMTLNEEKFISWLADHGYVARKSDEIGNYFRAGDTVSLPTRNGVLQVSFFGTTVEDLFLDGAPIGDIKIMTVL